MKFSNGSVTAVILAATWVMMTTTTEAATSRRRGLKNSKANNGNKFKLLAVQKGKGCYIYYGGESDVYTLSITDMEQETIQFQERPGRQASIISTGNFTQEFSTNFPLNDLPNAAISFQQGSTLIVQLSNPTPFDNGGSALGMKYTVKQSPSQAAVKSLADIAAAVNNDDVDNDGFVSDSSCSLFIDTYESDLIAYGNSLF